jgi:hypothetical protein
MRMCEYADVRIVFEDYTDYLVGLHRFFDLMICAKHSSGENLRCNARIVLVGIYRI